MYAVDQWFPNISPYYEAILYLDPLVIGCMTMSYISYTV